jgi:hypothetical protein
MLRYLIKPGAAVKKVVEEYWLGEKVQLVTAPELIAELAEVLARDAIRALIRPTEGQTLLDAVRSTAEHLPALSEVPAYTRDPKDDKFIACAVRGQAEWLITLDKDLLTIKELGGVRIVMPAEFVALNPVE